jgi:hypothetical protein
MAAPARCAWRAFARQGRLLWEVRVWGLAEASAAPRRACEPAGHILQQGRMMLGH